MQAATNPDAVVYRGFTIEPSFTSKHGTGRHCETLQGWVAQTPAGVNVRELWGSSLKRVKAEIDHLCDDVNVRVETRIALLRHAGEIERADQISLVAAAAKRADEAARAEREAARAKAQALADAAPELLAFIQKRVAEYVPTQASSDGPIYPAWYAEAQALIAQATNTVSA